MNYPDFFDKIPSIELKDPLSSMLGTFENGELDISYLDVVKGSGHSCPTVAGAYLMCYHALKTLFPNERAIRGGVSIKIAKSVDEGTTGVVSNVISYITGATDKSGFKGINGNFPRNNLMAFNQKVLSFRFTRVDNGKSVDLFYDPSSIEIDPKQVQLLELILKGEADTQQKKEFAKLWQERVKKILIDNFDNSTILIVVEL